MIDRVEAGVCISRFNKKDNWVVYKPPVCGNGRPARVAVWEGDRRFEQRRRARRAAKPIAEQESAAPEAAAQAAVDDPSLKVAS